MKRIALCAASLIFLTNNCASSGEALAPKIPSEVSGFVSCRYQDSMIKLFNGLKINSQEFELRAASQVYFAFLNDGANAVMKNLPALVEHADKLQQNITKNNSSAVIPLMREALTGKKDSEFWECFHSCVRISLTKRVKEIILYPTDLDTLVKNTIPLQHSKGKDPIETQPDLAAALIITARMMEFNYQQDPESFEALFTGSHYE